MVNVEVVRNKPFDSCISPGDSILAECIGLGQHILVRSNRLEGQSNEKWLLHQSLMYFLCFNIIPWSLMSDTLGNDFREH